VDDLRAAGAGEPRPPAVPPAVQIAATLVLSDKSHQGVQHVRHGAGDYHRPNAKVQ